MDSEMHSRYLGYWGSVETSMCSGILIGTTDTHVSHLPVIREMTHFGRGELTSQVPEESRFLSISQKSSNSHGWVRFWIFGSHYGVWGIEFSLFICTLQILCLFVCFWGYFCLIFSLFVLFFASTTLDLRRIRKCIFGSRYKTLERTNFCIRPKSKAQFAHKLCDVMPATKPQLSHVSHLSPFSIFQTIFSKKMCLIAAPLERDFRAGEIVWLLRVVSNTLLNSLIFFL